MELYSGIDLSKILGGQRTLQASTSLLFQYVLRALSMSDA